jgi:hypothetical protein
MKSSAQPEKDEGHAFSTPQLARLHGLDDIQLNSSVDGKEIERVSTFRLFGPQFYHNLKLE